MLWIGALILPVFSVILGAFLNKRLYAKLSTLLTGLSFIWALALFITGQRGDSFWFLRFDGLGTLLATYILLVSLVIHKYSENYMKEEIGYKRFFLLLDLITLNLLLLVLSDHMLLLFAFWHLMGVLLFFLLSFNHRRGEAYEYAKMALFTHRLADIPLLVAVLLLYKTYQTFSIGELSKLVIEKPSESLWIITLLIMLSAFAKSAQIPFHLWLVYSMEGPTPVSALMHAGIVNAGAFLANRFSFLFLHDEYALGLSFLVGIITALIGSMLMLMQNDVKKALGYSTVGQMGYMMMEVGVGAFALSVYHMMTHGIFKATLFLSSGSVIHDARRDTNIPRDEVYDAIVKKERKEGDTPLIIYGMVALIIPVLLVLLAHFFFEKEVFEYKAPLILLFFGWITSAQILINLFKVGREKPFLTISLGTLSLFILLSVYVLAGQVLQKIIYPYGNFQELVFEKALSNYAFFIVGVLLSALIIAIGWILLYYAGKDKPLKLQFSLYTHLSRELYIPDVYKLIASFLYKLARALSVASLGAVPMYAFYYYGDSIPINTLLLAFLIPIFPISLLVSYLIRNFWLFVYPILVALGFVGVSLLELSSDSFILSLASFTFLLHSIRASLSENVKELLSELYPALLSLVWLAGSQSFIPLAISTLLFYLIGIYMRNYFKTTSFGYVGGTIEKLPILSFLFILASLYVVLTPPMHTFYALFDGLLKANTLQALFLLLGWLAIGIGVVNSSYPLLYGKPREDIHYFGR